MFAKSLTLFLLVLYVKRSVGVLEFDRELQNGYKYFDEIGGYLKLHNNPTDWMTARLNCHSEDAVVASPWNAGFTSLIHRLQRTQTLHSGAEVAFREGIYKRNNKGEIYLSLDPSDIGDGLGRCVAFFSNGTTGEVGCQEQLPYFCYTPVHRTCGGFESGYELSPETGHCYKYHKTQTIWTSASATCLIEGAKLAVINSDAELQVITRLIARFPRRETTYPDLCENCAHVGAFYWNATNSWLTIHGQTLEQAGFSIWFSGYPKTNESFAAIHREGALVSIRGDHYAPFICEKGQ